MLHRYEPQCQIWTQGDARKEKRTVLFVGGTVERCICIDDPADIVCAARVIVGPTRGDAIDDLAQRYRRTERKSCVRQVSAIPSVGIVEYGSEEPCGHMNNRTRREQNARRTNDAHEANSNVSLGPPRSGKGAT